MSNAVTKTEHYEVEFGTPPPRHVGAYAIDAPTPLSDFFDALQRRPGEWAKVPEHLNPQTVRCNACVARLFHVYFETRVKKTETWVRFVRRTEVR